MNDRDGVLSSIFDTGSGDNVASTLEHVVVSGSTDVGFYLRSNQQATCSHCTAIQSGDAGFVADTLSYQPRSASMKCDSCAAYDNATEGFDIGQQDGGWSVSNSNSFGNATNFQPSNVPELVAVTQTDPQRGGCLVYSPSATTDSLGAQIIYRYQDGQFTEVPLWHPLTGAFPCGAVVVGVNDDPATSCIGVNERLHVGAADCALPYPAL